MEIRTIREIIILLIPIISHPSYIQSHLIPFVYSLLVPTASSSQIQRTWHGTFRGVLAVCQLAHEPAAQSCARAGTCVSWHNDDIK